MEKSTGNDHFSRLHASSNDLPGASPPYEQNVPYSTTTPAQPMMHQEFVLSINPLNNRSLPTRESADSPSQHRLHPPLFSPTSSLFPARPLPPAARPNSAPLAAIPKPPHDLAAHRLAAERQLLRTRPATGAAGHSNAGVPAAAEPIPRRDAAAESKRGRGAGGLPCLSCASVDED